MPAHPLIDTIAISLVLAFIFGLIAHRLKISPLVGYLIAGIIVGPHTNNGLFADTEIASQLAEIGVILLMFGVGLHFSFKDLLSVKTIAIPGAIAQIAVATLLGMGLASLLGWELFTGIIFGLCLSTASTVVLLRALEERQLINSQRGQIAIGWLIVEDLAMVLALVLLPATVGLFQQESANISQLLIQLLFTVGKVAAFIALMLLGGTKLVPWLLAKSAGTGSRELFTLAVLAIAMGIALGSVLIFDVSFALGAFFAGMVLNESELSHRAAHDTLPLRDAFAVLFFVSIGMLFDPTILFTHYLAVIATVIIIVVGKSLAAYLLVRMLKHSQRTALTIAASLAQIGEFAFILAALGMQLNLLSYEAQNLVLAGAIISILLNPIIFNLAERYLKQTEISDEHPLKEVIHEEQQIALDLDHHIIVVGYGRVGSTLSKQLQQIGVPLAVIENAPAPVEVLSKQDIPMIVGNAADEKILHLAGIQSASHLIVTASNGYEVGEIVAAARNARPDLEIIARAHYDDEIEYIAQHGATHIIMSEREIALSILQLLTSEVPLHS